MVQMVTKEAEKIGSKNVFIEGETIMTELQKEVILTKILQLNRNGWRMEVRKKIKEAADNEVTTECNEGKSRENAQSKRKLQKYLTEYSKQDARTIFDVLASIIDIERNFGEKENRCFLCGRRRNKQST